MVNVEWLYRLSNSELLEEEKDAQKDTEIYFTTLLFTFVTFLVLLIAIGDVLLEGVILFTVFIIITFAYQYGKAVSKYEAIRRVIRTRLIKEERR